jgi:peptide chain release factor 2
MDAKGKIEQIKSALKISEKKEWIKQIESEMQSAGFWDNKELAGQKTKELKDLKSEVDKVEEIEELVEIAGNGDIPAIEEEIKKLEILTYFSGKYDDHSAIINFYAGAGGDDAQDWTKMLMSMYLNWAQISGYGNRILSQSFGSVAGIKSATIEISGIYAYGKLKNESGVHRLVRLSPFNARSLRQTSFSLIEAMPKIEKQDSLDISPSDLKIDTFRASGHGGQSVNTTDSAIRITHIPTGVVVSCQNERSQLQNKENAMSVLRSRLAKMLEDQHKEKIDEIRGQQAEPEWGSQIRSYVLHPYKQVKDHRTGHESKDPESVLAGDLDGFIESEIKK